VLKSYARSKSQVFSPALHEYGVFGNGRKKGCDSVKMQNLFPVLSTLSRAVYNLYITDTTWKYNYNNFNTCVYPNKLHHKIYTSVILIRSSY
jgi:hypothetical protein